jgi:hypothetical protein
MQGQSNFGDPTGLLIRWNTGNSDGYVLGINDEVGAEFKLIKVDGFSLSDITSAAISGFSNTTTYTIQVELDGDQLRCACYTGKTTKTLVASFTSTQTDNQTDTIMGVRFSSDTNWINDVKFVQHS